MKALALYVVRMSRDSVGIRSVRVCVLGAVVVGCVRDTRCSCPHSPVSGVCVRLSVRNSPIPGAAAGNTAVTILYTWTLHTGIPVVSSFVARVVLPVA